MNNPNNHVIVGHPAKPVKVTTADGDAGVVLVAGLLLAAMFWIKMKPVPVK